MEQLSFYKEEQRGHITTITSETISYPKKGGFWKKCLRVGSGSNSPKYDGKLAKTDANTSRSKLKRFLDKYIF